MEGKNRRCETFPASQVLGRVVRQGWLEEDAATAILAWPHAGFGASESTADAAAAA